MNQATQDAVAAGLADLEGFANSPEAHAHEAEVERFNNELRAFDISRYPFAFPTSNKAAVEYTGDHELWATKVMRIAEFIHDLPDVTVPPQTTVEYTGDRELWATKVMRIAEFIHGLLVVMVPPQTPTTATVPMNEGPSQSTVPSQRNSVLPKWLAEFDHLRPTPTIPSAQRRCGANVAGQGHTNPPQQVGQTNQANPSQAQPNQEHIRYSGRPPPPRIQQLDHVHINVGDSRRELPSMGPYVLYHLRMMAAFSLDSQTSGLTSENVHHGQVNQGHGTQVGPENIEPNEVNGFLQELLEEIDE
ncbi:hypothetical protein GGR52DRAFT_584423 [Hypoxylon sp. FL1284]|nr:hypothetical protein GGR52DRAFT_584423 [Hypoxylon sp. FL1284]